MGNTIGKGLVRAMPARTSARLQSRNPDPCEVHGGVSSVETGTDVSTSACPQAKKLRDPTWLPLLFTDCNGEIRIAWAKADTGADANFISASMLNKLGEPPSDEPLLDASNQTSGSCLVRGGLGLNIPEHRSPRPLTIRTFDGSCTPVDRIATLTFRTGDGVYTADFEVITRATDNEHQDPALNGDIDLLIGRDWLLDNHALTLDPVFFRTPVGYKHVLEPVMEASQTEQFFELFASTKKGTKGPTTRPPGFLEALGR